MIHENKMITERYLVKGMICRRCLKVLNEELNALGTEVVDLRLGLIDLKYDPNTIDKLEIEKVICENEFEILKDKDGILAEQTKRWVIDYIWTTDQKQNLSEYLTRKLNINYPAISRNFSKIFGSTIERYSIILKMERVKEWIEYDEKQFSEMAYDLNYQNLSALSRQFKRETGISMKAYKSLRVTKRIPLDII